MAKYNHKGRLVTTPKDIKKVFLKEFKDRLRPRKIKSSFEKHVNHAHKVLKLKLEVAWKK